MTAPADTPKTGPVQECTKCPRSPGDGRRARYIDDELGHRAHRRAFDHSPEPVPTPRGAA